MARQTAERANLATSQFVTALSHELRTPLRAITGFTENLQTLDLSSDQRRLALERIGLASTHILSIVDDAVDLARVEAGAMPVDRCDVEAHAVIDESLELSRPPCGPTQRRCRAHWTADHDLRGSSPPATDDPCADTGSMSAK